MFAAVVAIGCAADLLYEPMFSFYVSDPLQVGELVSFAVGIARNKRAAEILRPETKNPTANFRSDDFEFSRKWAAEPCYREFGPGMEGACQC